MRVCPPGSGYFDSAAQRAAMMRDLALEAELARLRRNALSAEARLAAAQRARQSGQTRIAGRLYMRLGLVRRSTPPQYAQAAHQALSEMRDEARAKLAEIEYRLDHAQPVLEVASEEVDSSEAQIAEIVKAFEEIVANYKPQWVMDRPEAAPSRGSQEILDAFKQLEQLAWDYDTVPTAKKELDSRWRQLRRDARFAAALNEPKAVALWERGREHERGGEGCCAYLAFQEAARLLPAPSAKQAQARLQQRQGDAQFLASVERCQRLRACHKTYQLAELFAAVPERSPEARRLFEKVVADSPQDSPIHTAAQTQLAKLQGTL